MKETVHLSPPPGQQLTPCCGKSPFDLPLWRDRVTVDPSLVTCHTELRVSDILTDYGEDQTP